MDRSIENGDFRSLLAYQRAFDLAMVIFEISKKFPKEERYSLTDQIRRSSRSVCAQLAEGYRKRAYPKYFFSKTIDADGENAETLVWLEFALSCKYINQAEFEKLKAQNREVGRLLGTMLKRSKSFL
jgi:four helix bundle protein